MATELRQRPSEGVGNTCAPQVNSMIESPLEFLQHSWSMKLDLLVTWFHGPRLILFGLFDLLVNEASPPVIAMRGARGTCAEAHPWGRPERRSIFVLWIDEQMETNTRQPSHTKPAGHRWEPFYPACWSSHFPQTDVSSRPGGVCPNPPAYLQDHREACPRLVFSLFFVRYYSSLPAADL